MSRTPEPQPDDARIGAERWALLRDVFEKVCSAPTADRAAVLATLCDGDPLMGDEVASLLRAGEADMLEGHGAPTVVGVSPVSPGGRVGNYLIVERLGEGGFGTVYLAQQSTPIVRTVALKVIREGMDTREVIARFEAERQALAAMDHPGIARVLDAGSTDAGRPFFVMELVRGVPITEYCATAKAPVRARLALFQQVCHAVQHAHQKGIIHRDLKPSNILVTQVDGRPAVKVIDFGIAKAAGWAASTGPVLTHAAALLGTPLYMAPEQADLGPLDLDTRADIYSLGIVLYELLTGTTPLAGDDLLRAGFAELRRLIREVEPPKPSTRAELVSGTRTERRASTAITTASELRGDLDWIVMKALEKDRSRRYESAADLAADIGRYLAGQAVTAAPPSQVYRARKFIRRHRVGVAAAATVALGLLASSIIATRGLLRAERALEREAAARLTAEKATERATASEAAAKVELARSTAVLGFMQEVLQSPLPQRSGADVRVVELLRRSDAMIQGRFDNLPDTELAVRELITGLLLAVEAYADAEPHAARALELALETRPMQPGAEQREEDLSWMRRWYQPLWKISVHATRPLLPDQVVERLSRRYGEADPRVLALKKAALASSTATRFYQQAARQEASAPTADRTAAPSAVDRAKADYDAAVRDFGERDPRVVESLFKLAQRQASHRLLDDADASYAAALRVDQSLRSPSDPTLLERSIEYAVFRARRAPKTEAVSVLQTAIADARQNGGASTASVIPALLALAESLARSGDATSGLDAAREACAVANTALGPLHSQTFMARQALMLRLMEAGRTDEVLAEADALLRDAQSGTGPDGPLVGAAHGMRAAALRGLGRLPEAAESYRSSIAALEKAQPALPMLTFTPRLDLADCLISLERWEEAEHELRWFVTSDGPNFKPGVFASMQSAVAKRFRRLYGDPAARQRLPHALERLELWDEPDLAPPAVEPGASDSHR